MPKLPDYTALGTVEPRASGIVPSYSAAGFAPIGAGAALEKVGNEMIGISREEKYRAEHLQASQAEADLTIGLDKHYVDAVQSPDYQAAPGQFRAGAQSALEAAAGHISDPNQREIFLNRGRARMEGYALRLENHGFNRLKQDVISANDQRLTDLGSVALGSDDPQIRNDTLKQGASIIDGEVKAGYINAREALQRKRRFVEGYGEAYVKDLVQKNPEAAYKLLTPSGERAPSTQAQAVTKTAGDLGIDPRDLAAVISYETGGTFDPNVRGGKGNNYLGLIQFGPEERAKYGVRPGMSFENQMKAVGAYLKDRGVKPGMSLDQVYSVVNAGSLGPGEQPRYGASDGNGTVRDHVARIQNEHYGNAERFLGGTMLPKTNTPVDFLRPDQVMKLRHEATVALRQQSADPPPRVSAMNTRGIYEKLLAGQVQSREEIDAAYLAALKDPARGISRTDHDWLISQFEQGKTGDGATLQRRQGEFFKAVEPMINNPLDMSYMTGADDRKLKMYSFELDAERKVQQYRKEGKNPFDLFDPTKPDYLGRPEAISPYQKSLQTMLPATAPKPQGSQPVSPNQQGAPTLQKRLPGESLDAWMKRTGHGIGLPSANATPQVPVSQ